MAYCPPVFFLNCYLPGHWLFESSCFSSDYDAFLGDLEEDEAYRQNVNIYVGKFVMRHVFSRHLLRKSFVFKRFYRHLSNFRSRLQRIVGWWRWRDPKDKSPGDVRGPTSGWTWFSCHVDWVRNLILHLLRCTSVIESNTPVSVLWKWT